MTAYIIRRLLWTPVILLIVSFVTFALGHFGPGDPIQVLMGQKNNPDAVERIRRERGLDRPFLEQYVAYIIGAPKEHRPEASPPEQVANWLFGERKDTQRGVIRGDFGESYNKAGQRVSDIVFRRAWVSVQLGVIAEAIGVIVGVALGLLAAVKQGRRIDPAIVTGSLFISSLPIFILQPILALVLSRQLKLLPSSGWETGVLGLGIFSPHVIMPALVMSLGPIGSITRMMRSSTLEIIHHDFVRTARAKGLPEGVVRTRHIARNAILPVFTVVGLSLAPLVAGSFVTETLFAIPGMGALAFDSFFQRDYPIIMAITLLLATAYIVVNLLVDIGYTFLDPRIRLR